MLLPIGKHRDASRGTAVVRIIACRQDRGEVPTLLLKMSRSGSGGFVVLDFQYSPVAMNEAIGSEWVRCLCAAALRNPC